MCLNNYMKSFTRIKKINGQEYLYEITPYYDKEKKQIRQKSKYLGKNVEGVPVRVRSQEKVPKKVLSHGEFVPLKKIIEDLELEKTLSEVLPAKKVWPVLTLAMNYAIRPRGLTHIQSWYEALPSMKNILIFPYPPRASLECSVISVKAQRTSNSLANLSREYPHAARWSMT